MLTLRNYQITMLNDAISCLNAGEHPFVVSPTGSGKMIVIAALAKHLQMNVLIVEHRIELVKQAIEKLELIGEKPGLIVSGIPDLNPIGRIKVGMIQTIHRRGTDWEPGAIIIDEAHLSAAASYQKLLERHGDAGRICFSATPWRLDGKGFRNISDRIVYGPTIKELVRDRYLVPTTFLPYDVADFSDVKMIGNEYDQDQVASILDNLNGYIVNEWRAKASNRSTVVFAANTTHSKRLCAEFKNAGYKAEHIDGSTPDGVRAAIIARVRSGETQILCNCGIVVEGFDAPIVSCIVLAIATQSLSKYLQCCGRGMRLSPETNKRDVIVMDFGNCHEIHGYPEDDREWTLNQRKIRSYREKEYIEDGEAVDDNTTVIKYTPVTYQPNMHDYGGNAEYNDEMWRRKYAASPEARARYIANQQAKQAAGQPGLQLGLPPGTRQPPRWLPANWRDYWYSLENYRISMKLPIDYSELTVRAEIAKRARR